jgi:predicted ester cyclase
MKSPEKKPTQATQEQVKSFIEDLVEQKETPQGLAGFGAMLQQAQESANKIDD